MKIRLVIPTVNVQPTARPQRCSTVVTGGCTATARVTKPLRDHRQAEVIGRALPLCRDVSAPFGTIPMG